MKLSGGERLRVAIARALLRRPRLLLLDEATSQLDAVNEAALRDTIAAAARTTTVLVVAHRLSTVTLADRIIVMDAGRVCATGTHRELVVAVAAGASWGDIGRALKVTEDSATEQDVLDALARQKREVWRRFWG